MSESIIKTNNCVGVCSNKKPIATYSVESLVLEIDYKNNDYFYNTFINDDFLLDWAYDTLGDSVGVDVLINERECRVGNKQYVLIYLDDFK